MFILLRIRGPLPTTQWRCCSPGLSRTKMHLQQSVRIADDGKAVVKLKNLRGARLWEKKQGEFYVTIALQKEIWRNFVKNWNWGEQSATLALGRYVAIMFRAIWWLPSSTATQLICFVARFCFKYVVQIRIFSDISYVIETHLKEVWFLYHLHTKLPEHLLLCSYCCISEHLNVRWAFFQVANKRASGQPDQRYSLSEMDSTLTSSSSREP